MDFANKKIGGGVLGGGCVQEEIKFCLFPELLISLLIMDHMENNEAIIITVRKSAMFRCTMIIMIIMFSILGKKHEPCFSSLFSAHVT